MLAPLLRGVQCVPQTHTMRDVREMDHTALACYWSLTAERSILILRASVVAAPCTQPCAWAEMAYTPRPLAPD